MRSRTGAICGLLLCLAGVVWAGCASAPRVELPLRLADGSAVAPDAEVLFPKPTGGLPTDFVADLGAKGYRGRFVADLVVDGTGRVTDVLVLQTIDQRVDGPIAQRLRAVRFEPARVDGEPVAVLYRVQYDLTSR